MSSAARPAKKTTPRDGVDRRQVLDAASRLLVDEGPSALTMRRLASEVGASTMVLYSRFESRDELLSQLLAEGFSRFGDALAEVAHPDPFEQLRELGRAYRRFALENTAYFRLMWGPPLGDCATRPTPNHRAYQALLFSVTRVLAALDRPAREAEPLAGSVWSAVHGFVSLELAGAIRHGDPGALYELTLDFVMAALRR